MTISKLDLKNLSKDELIDLYQQTLNEKEGLEHDRENLDQKMLRSKQRTIDVFGKMVDHKKTQKIISWQNEELEAKNQEILQQKTALEHTYQKFRSRTIELFGKMIDLKKANKLIQQQKEEIEKQRKQLHEINASKDKFFSILAHDLKNPIAGFLGLTEMMSRKMNELTPEIQQSFADNMFESSKQLYALLENLLNWARSQTGSLKIDLEKTDLNKLLDEAINQVSMNAQLKNINLRKQENISTQVFVDHDTMNTIFRNLLSNAIKFSNPESSIDIIVSQSNKVASLSITDYGIGIAPENVEKLFKIHHNISKPGTENEQGTGLGLILCKEFIEQNKGTISVDSTLGKGSTFTISVPLSE